MPKKKLTLPTPEADAFDPDAHVSDTPCDTCKHCPADHDEYICEQPCDDSYSGYELYNDNHWLAKETVTVTQELTQAEKAEYAEEMANAQGEKDRLESELDGIKKGYKRLIDAEDSRISQAAKIVRNGKEERSIFCDKVADYKSCEIVWTDAHPPHAEVQRRKMTAEERQLPLVKTEKPSSKIERDCSTCFYNDEGMCANDDDPECDAINLSRWKPMQPVSDGAEQPGAAMQ